MTIYVVTEGEYSDYHIIHAFIDKEKAEACSAACRGSDIEEYDSESLDMRGGLKEFVTEMDLDGNTTRIYCSRACHEASSEADYWGHAYPPRLHAVIHARDEQHATKIMNERRVAWILENGAKVGR
jgi:hypothetical protein